MTLVAVALWMLDVRIPAREIQGEFAGIDPPDDVRRRAASALDLDYLAFPSTLTLLTSPDHDVVTDVRLHDVHLLDMGAYTQNLSPRPSQPGPKAIARGTSGTTSVNSSRAQWV